LREVQKTIPRRHPARRRCRVADARLIIEWAPDLYVTDLECLLAAIDTMPSGANSPVRSSRMSKCRHDEVEVEVQMSSP
jgi:hypothetical protein